MLDTNTLSYAASGRSMEARSRLEIASGYASIVASAVSLGELEFGFALRPEATRYRGTMERVLASIVVAPWTTETARVYGALRAELTRNGLAVDALDLMIAAHAKSLGATLVTHDKALLRLTSYLDVVDWATDL